MKLSKLCLIALAVALPVAAAAKDVPPVPAKQVVPQGDVAIVASYAMGSSTVYLVLLDGMECIAQQVPNGSLTPGWVVQSCNWKRVADETARR